MPNPPYIPGRQAPNFDVRTNPLDRQPSMDPPPWNPGGLLPAVSATRGAENWTEFKTQDFLSDGTNRVWTYLTPVFDLRPAVTLANGQTGSVQPINHEGALGQAVYLTLLLGSIDGLTPPALVDGITAEYWEDGNNVAASPMRRLTQEIDITDTLYAGGTSLQTLTAQGEIIVPGGASIFQFTPVIPGLHYWRVGFRLTISGTAAITSPFFINGALH